MPAGESQNREERPRARRRQAVARRLMDEGLGLLARRGLHACRVEEITQAAQVGKGTFFTHFPSKDAFVARLVDQVLGDLARRVRPVSLAPIEAEALLAGVGGVHLRYFQLRPEAASLIVQACGLPAGGDGFGEARRRLAEHLDLVAGMLAPAAAHLGWPAEHSRELALAMLSLSCGYFWFGQALGPAQAAPMALLDRLGRVWARGLSQGPQAPGPA